MYKRSDIKRMKYQMQQGMQSKGGGPFWVIETK